MRSLQIMLMASSLLLPASISAQAVHPNVPSSHPSKPTSSRIQPPAISGAAGKLQKVDSSMNVQDTTIQRVMRQFAALRGFLQYSSRNWPGTNSNIPNGFGLTRGTVAIGLGIQARTRNGSRPDGALALMTGLGNPSRIGLDAGVTILDLTSRNGGGFAQRGSFDLKVHRVLGHDFGIAIGCRHVLGWGGTDSPSSVYLVATRVGDVPGRSGGGNLLTTAGVWLSGESSADLELMGSLTWRILRPVNVIVEWTGDDLSFGGSIAPLENVPFVLTPVVTDLTGRGGDRPRLIFSTGLRFSLL